MHKGGVLVKSYAILPLLDKKAKAVAEVHRQNKGEQVLSMVEQAAPYFHHKKAAPCLEFYQPEKYIFEWVERRRAEGGDDLVAAWAWVLQDLAQAL